MPPRYAYWTILVDNRPTAFRAATLEDLLPTFEQIRRKHPSAVMRWFARGRIWESPAHAAREERSPRERRDRSWRPGGNHRDPRARFEQQRKDRNAARRRERFSHRSNTSPGAIIGGPAARPGDRHGSNRHTDRRPSLPHGERPRPSGTPPWRDAPRDRHDRDRQHRGKRDRRETDRQDRAVPKTSEHLRGRGAASGQHSLERRKTGTPPAGAARRDRPPRGRPGERRAHGSPPVDSRDRKHPERQDRQPLGRDRKPRPDRRRGHERGPEGPPPGPDRPPRPGQEPPPVPTRSEEIVIPPAPPERGREGDTSPDKAPPAPLRDDES
jgi:hypothetical protein